MSRTKRFLGGISVGYLSQAVITLVGLWLTPFLLRHLGQDGFGLWQISAQVLVYLTLMDFGVVALLPREVAYAIGRAGGVDAATDLQQMIGQTVRLALWQMPVVIVAAFILWSVATAEWVMLRRPLGLVMLTFVALFPLRVLQAILSGLQDLTFLGAGQLVAWVISTILTVVLALSGFGLEALAISWVVGQVLPVAWCWYRLRNRFAGVLPARLPVLQWQVARAQLRKSFWVSLSQISAVLLNATDLFILGMFFGPAAIVPYVCTSKLVSVLTNQPQMVMAFASPILSEMKMGESRQRLFQVCTALTQAMLMLSGAIICVLLVVNQGFVNWWVGPQHYGGASLTMLLSLSMLLRHWNMTAVYSIFCFGYERRISLTTLLDGLVTIISTMLCAWRLGPIGAPIGSMIGVSLISLPANLAALARESGVSALTLIKPLWSWFWRFLLLGAGASFVAKVWAPGTWQSLVMATIIAASIYVVVMLAAALNSELGIYLRPQLAALRMRFSGMLLANNVDS